MGSDGGRVLGRFTPSQLRAGGINRRGLLQPLLPAEGQDPVADRWELARAGLLVRDAISPDGWQAAGVLGVVMEMAMVARTILCVEAPEVRPRFVFHRLGVTTSALDLRPDGDGYVCWAGPVGEAVDALIPAVLPAGPTLPVARSLMESDRVVWRLQAISVLEPCQPPLQHDLRILVLDDDRPWLRLGARLGGDAGSWAAPANPVRLRRVLLAVSRAEQVEV